MKLGLKKIPRLIEWRKMDEIFRGRRSQVRGRIKVVTWSESPAPSLVVFEVIGLEEREGEVGK